MIVGAAGTGPFHSLGSAGVAILGALVCLTGVVVVAPVVSADVPDTENITTPGS